MVKKVTSIMLSLCVTFSDRPYLDLLDTFSHAGLVIARRALLSAYEEWSIYSGMTSSVRLTPATFSKGEGFWKLSRDTSHSRNLR